MPEKRKTSKKYKTRGGKAKTRRTKKWSLKYKRSINCARPRGFSQRAHCQGRNKNEDEQLDELQFLGSECTKDCSGHRAGYDWSARKGNIQGNSPYSPSFNKGANLRAAGK
jgi:hypothetical protein